MKKKELAETFMTISYKNHYFGPDGLCKNISAFTLSGFIYSAGRGLRGTLVTH